MWKIGTVGHAEVQAARGPWRYPFGKYMAKPARVADRYTSPNGVVPLEIVLESDLKV